MRLHNGHIPYLLFFFLPIVISLLKANILITFCSILLLALVRFPLDFKRRCVVDAKSHLVLETVGGSPFVEKVRWIMDVANIEYEEEPDVALIISLLTSRKVPRLQVPCKMLSVAESSDIVRYLHGLFVADPSRSSFLATSGDMRDFELRMNDYALTLRAFVLQALLEAPNANDLLLRHFSYRASKKTLCYVPWWQSVLMTMMTPLLKFLVRLKFDLVKSSTEYLRETKDFLEDVDAMLEDGRDFLLNEDHMTHLDVAFAALASFHALPDHALHLGLTLDQVPKNYRDEVLRFRETKAGQFVLKMYEKHR